MNRGGSLVRFTTRPGNEYEAKDFPALLGGVEPSEQLIADKAYDSDSIRDWLTGRGTEPVIPNKTLRRRRIHPFDDQAYRTRHVVENYFARLKQYRGVATRYCKLAETFRSFVCVAAWALETKGAVSSG